VDIAHGTGNNKEAFVWEPLLVKVNALKAATEAACTILSIDETVRNPKS
jgi:T-complex protein 1 subunit eta